MSLENILTPKQQSFILNLSIELKTQDNLSTASPYLYILTQKRQEVRPETHASDYVLCLDFETQFYNNDELIEYTADEYPALTEWLEDNLEDLSSFLNLDIDDGLQRVVDEYNDFCCHYDDMSIVYFEERQEVSKNDLNVFFTRKAYDKHVRANSHRYNTPKPYINHAFRNPELEQLLEIVGVLGQSIEVNKTTCRYTSGACIKKWVCDE